MRTPRTVSLKKLFDDTDDIGDYFPEDIPGFVDEYIEDLDKDTVVFVTVFELNGELWGTRYRYNYFVGSDFDEAQTIKIFPIKAVKRTVYELE